MKNIIFVLIINIFLSFASYSSNEEAKAKVNKNIRRISTEQKLYELSVVWRELSYNFANMDNCPSVNLDSLYREYMPIVQNTKNDWEYYKAIQRFLSHFNNGHTICYSFPDYFVDYLGLLLLKTTYKDCKVIVENIGAHFAKKISIGDEIVSVNGIPVIDYLQINSIPFISTSNEEAKSIQRATFGASYVNYALKDEKIRLGIKTSKGKKTVQLSYDKHFNPNSKDTIKQNKKTYLNKESGIHSQTLHDNLFLIDTVNDFAYIRLTRCDKTFYSFFIENYEKILEFECSNLIIDVHNNGGGDGNFVRPVVSYLINNDTIYNYVEKTRVNHALYKAKASSKIFYYEDNEVAESFKERMYPYYYNTAFAEIQYGYSISNVPDFLRYKGKIHVLIGAACGSAGEDFVALLSQNNNVSFFGKQTAGAFGQPLITRLPSGIEVHINTTKSYDFQGRDISSGFPPDYEYDFSEIYRITDQQEMLNKFLEVINVEKKEKRHGSHR